MRKKMVLAFMLALISVLGFSTAQAALVIGDGLDDWGITNPATGLVNPDAKPGVTGSVETGLANPVNYWEGSSFTAPGGGGNPFDIRGLYFTYDASKLYLAAVVGMPQSGIIYGDKPYYMGDFAISFDGNASVPVQPFGYEFGLSSTTGGFYQVSSWVLSSYHPDTEKTYSINTGTKISDAEFSYLFGGTDLRGDYYIIEAAIDLPGAFTSPSFTTIYLTESCGNDVANVTGVPEPGTMGLLGFGMTALAFITRRRSVRK